MRGEPKRKAHRDVKAKLPNVEMNVIVQERFTSPLNIAVWTKNCWREKILCDLKEILYKPRNLIGSLPVSFPAAEGQVSHSLFQEEANQGGKPAKASP